MFEILQTGKRVVGSIADKEKELLEVLQTDKRNVGSIRKIKDIHQKNVITLCTI